jgi:hypothetical protein
MAETKVSARDYILLADLAGGTTFIPVACLTTNSFTSTVNTIDATSKCGDQFQVGPSFTQSFKADGFAIDETGTPSKDSYQQLYAAHAAKTTFTIKMGKASPVTGDVYYGGTSTSLVFISNFDVTAADKDDVKFTATFVVVNPPIAQTEVTV